MKIVLTLLVRDELDIIESNLAYHFSQGIDFIIAMDNGSRDGTDEILREYAGQHPMEVLYEPASDYLQRRWVTRMARRAYERYGADWVINGDADEFFVWKSGTLREYFAAIPDTVQAFHADRVDFVPFDRLNQKPPPEEMIYRKTQSLNLKGRPLGPKAIHRGDPDVVVSQGNHGVRGPRFSKSLERGEIVVYHYPIRSYEQFETGVRNSGSSYARNTELPAASGFHKRYWYELLQKGKLPREFRRHFFKARRLKRALASSALCEDRTLADRLTGVAGSFG